MRRSGCAALWCFISATVLSLASPAVRPARADIDLNGPWGVATDMVGIGPSGCVLDVVQTGGALSISGLCLGSFSVSLSGTLDTLGGALSATGTGSTACAVVTITGTASLASDAWTGTFTCDAYSGPFAASRCGNGVVEAGEECDQGLYKYLPLGVHCCSDTCTALAAGTSCGSDDVCRVRACDGAGACTLQNRPEGTPCTDDANVCTDDVCDTGLCEHRANTAPCSDDNYCTDGDHCALGSCVGTCSPCCDAGAGCTPAPAAACKEPTAPSGPLALRLDSIASTTQSAAWSWRKGAETTLADFGDPTAATAYDFCVYRPRPPLGGVDLLLKAHVPAGGACPHANGVSTPCWVAKGDKGFVYKNPSFRDFGDGMRKILLRAGEAGRARVQLDGRGSRLHAQLYSGSDPVVAQVRASNGQCWSAGYVGARKDAFAIVGPVERLDYLARSSSPSGAFLDPIR